MGSYQLIRGDARRIPLADKSVHCVVTSPPYFGLRDYGTATWDGGDPGCDHLLATGPTQNKGCNGKFGAPFRDICGKCGARRIDSQIGLEPTPDEFVATMVAVFREVRRVLRDDGTAWVNLGDSYGSGKQLAGMPWRVALALQADGWHLRSDIIWAKPNPMPESVRDRPTKSHEHLFLLSKSQRYHYDADAVRERFQTDPRENYPARARVTGRGGQASSSAYLGQAQRDKSGGYPSFDAGRNLRDVWTIPTEAYRGAHFATFPRRLVMPCIKAGCPKGGTVLDPFNGSGTTGVVALALGRNYVGVDLSEEYLALAVKRLEAPSLPGEKKPKPKPVESKDMPGQRKWKWA